MSNREEMARLGRATLASIPVVTRPSAPRCCEGYHTCSTGVTPASREPEGAQDERHTHPFRDIKTSVPGALQ